MNPSHNLRDRKPDLSPFLFHFTSGGDPFSTINSIIEERCLICERNVNDYLKAVCFTESPLTLSLQVFSYMNSWSKPRFSRYGIGFKRDVLIRDYLARPVIYGDEHEYYDSQNHGYYHVHSRFGYGLVSFLVQCVFSEGHIGLYVIHYLLQVIDVVELDPIVLYRIRCHVLKIIREFDPDRIFRVKTHLHHSRDSVQRRNHNQGILAKGRKVVLHSIGRLAGEILESHPFVVF